MAWVAAHARILSGATLEKILLVGLISVVYAQVLPDLRSTSLQLFVGVSVFVVVNAALVILVARTGRSVEATAAAFAIRLAVNVALALSAGWALGGAGGDTNVPAMLFFVLLLTLITTLHDRYLPVHEVRRSQQDLSTPRRSDIAWRDK
jgi:hypothetical protein